MALVKLEIDGRRVIADSSRTILQVARQHGIDSIPTLCHDPQLEPFSSCFVCVVKVKGARTLVPACSTKVGNGMVVETGSAEVRQSRRAALELLLSDHYADCVGPCTLACPAGVDVQGYIALAAVGRYKDAIALIKEANPLPSVCGRVCTRPCEVKGCRRSLLDEAVAIDYIKRYLADLDLGGGDMWQPEVGPFNGRRVAVVGAGPAGLSAAHFLAIRGYSVEVFEAQPEAGGMLRYGIPEYRLPKDVLDMEVSQILSLGVKLHTNTALGREFTVLGLKEQGFDAIFLGLGAWRSSRMRVQNEEAPGVLSGIEFLKNVGLRKKVDIHGTVAVVGGGNAAIDCARTALRLGAREVKLLYRRTRAEMPANAGEVHDAIEEGVAIEFLVAPTRIVIDGNGGLTAVECLRMELGEPDASGRRSPKPVRGSEFQVPCGLVISAIGQSTTIEDLLDGKVRQFLPMGETLNLTRWQTVRVDEKTFETSVEGVFSGGDLVTGAATAIEAIAAGRKAAYAIDTYIREGRARPEPEQFLSRKDVFSTIAVGDLRSRDRKPRRVMPVIPVEERVRGFAEVERGYTGEDLRQEAARCLECGCVALFDCQLRKYATEYGVDVSHFLGHARQHERDTSHPLIELDQNKCILCGRCIRICSDVVGVAAFGWVNRGFSTMVAPALGGSLLDTGCVSCGLCVGTCPTGAIAQKLPLAKPGPWRTASVASVCHYCGVGCGIEYDTFGDTVVKVSRSEGNEVTFGNHCKKGRFGFNYLHAHDRLTGARVRPGRALQEAPIDEALRYAALRLKELARRCSGSEMAVFVSPRMTNEEVYLAQKLARIALKTHNISSFSHLVNPDLLAPDVLATASYSDVSEAQAILLTHSSLDDEHFVVDLVAKRAIRAGGRLIYIGPDANRTSAVADIFLRCRPEEQLTVVQSIVAEGLRAAGQDPLSRPELTGEVAGLSPAAFEQRTGVDHRSIVAAARLLAASLLKVLVFNRDYRGPRWPGDARLLAAAASALGCSLLPLHEKANAQGLLDMGAHPEWFPGYRAVTDEATVEELEKQWGAALRDLDTQGPGVARLLGERKIKAAIVLGEDPLGLEGLPAGLRAGLEAAECLVVADLFPTKTTRAAHVVLPMSSPAETSGTFTNSERRVQQVQQAVRPRAGIETWQILAELGARMGVRFKLQYASPAEIFEEIRRVAPIYRHVAVESEQAGGVWDAGAFPPSPERFGGAGTAPMTAPSPTAALDCLDARFTRWFSGLFPS
ncbi:MAG TPA: FAD-dependent oxidoreductase [Vicinamibacterales bacterium]|nr:FAD-dependent oxidoreductase [Vicinamibacterales bacterium]